MFPLENKNKRTRVSSLLEWFPINTGGWWSIAAVYYAVHTMRVIKGCVLCHKQCVS